jgi:hypothetical protein
LQSRFSDKKASKVADHRHGDASTQRHGTASTWRPEYTGSPFFHGSLAPSSPIARLGSALATGYIALYPAEQGSPQAPVNAISMIMGHSRQILACSTHDHGINTPIRVSRNDKLIVIF